VVVDTVVGFDVVAVVLVVVVADIIVVVDVVAPAIVVGADFYMKSLCLMLMHHCHSKFRRQILIM
jgi:hypothetical protein